VWGGGQSVPACRRYNVQGGLGLQRSATRLKGAHNTIVTSRAGKDLISCPVSGLLTIGPRFGGAIDDAARYFQDARDLNLDPDVFVEEMKRKGIRVPGIGLDAMSDVAIKGFFRPCRDFAFWVWIPKESVWHSSLGWFPSRPKFSKIGRTRHLKNIYSRVL
jgi:hypothetical protein